MISRFLKVDVVDVVLEDLIALVRQRIKDSDNR